MDSCMAASKSVFDSSGGFWGVRLSDKDIGPGDCKVWHWLTLQLCHVVVCSIFAQSGR